MPILYQHEIVRKPGYFSGSEIEHLSFLSHNATRESRNVKEWCKIGKSSYQKMIDAMNSFLNSDKAITSLKQFPIAIQSSLKYALENKETFSTKSFLENTNFNSLKKEIKILDDGSIDPNSTIASLIERSADTALAIHKTKNFINKSFDEKFVFKVLNLLVDAARLGKDRFTLINGMEYLDRPFIINVPCLNDIDPCKGSESMVRVEDENQEDEKDCPCDELKAKEKSCDCDKAENNPCECKCDDSCHTQNPCCAKIETFVAELFVVKDDVSCYKPGEIALIENIMKGEMRVKKHRHLQREETYSETEEENNTYNERDSQIDERFSLHKEIDKVVETDLSVDTGANYSSRAGSEKTFKSFNASLDVSYNRSKKDARKTVQDQSKNIITRAIEKVEKKVRTLTSRRMLNEIEEKNKHVFNGVNFDEHENGIYFFVNQERKAQVYSHGVRAMLDFYIPDPSKRLKSLLEKKFELKKPKKPCLNIKDIDHGDYLKYIQCYGFSDLEKPITEEIDLKLFVRGENPEVTKNNEQFTINESQTFVVPEGYMATEMKIVGFNSTHKDQEFWSKVFMRIDSGNVYIEHNDGHSWSTANSTKLVSSLSNLEGANTLSITNWNTTTYNITLNIKCKPKPETLVQWQLNVFNRIMEKYNKELEEYNKALEEFKRTKQEKFNQNPFMLSETIKEQLKHSVLEYITCQFFDENNGMRNKVKPCGLPQMDIPETEEFGKKVRFFEHAFEWKFLSYMLYPYFWAEKCSWDDKVQEDAQNGLFQKFLQSGYARVSLSIRPGFESLVQYYLEEGEIWGGVGLPSYGDPAYLPIHQEIKESKDNFNADREGYLIWDSAFTPALQKDEIIVKNDFATVEYIDVVPTSPTFGLLDPIKVAVDINRVIVIDCIEYRIISIDLVNGEVVLKLDRDLEHKDLTLCPDDFDNRYKDRNKLWSTGAKFEGAPWAFMVPTSLTWLKEDECLPCYPISCKENC